MTDTIINKIRERHKNNEPCFDDLSTMLAILDEVLSVPVGYYDGALTIRDDVDVIAILDRK
jgi:hypothetical protein